MGNKYDEAVRQLAAWHAEGMNPRVTVYAVPDPTREEVRLIEVSRAFPDMRTPVAVFIGPTRDFPFTSGTLCVTPSQLSQIEAGELPLPDGWDFGQSTKVWPRGAS